MNRLAKLAVFVMITALVSTAALHSISASPRIVISHRDSDLQGLTDHHDQSGQRGENDTQANHDDGNHGQTGDQETGEHADDDSTTQASHETNDDTGTGDQTTSGDQGQVGENTTDTPKSTMDLSQHVGEAGPVGSHEHPNAPPSADPTEIDNNVQAGPDTNIENAYNGPLIS